MTIILLIIIFLAFISLGIPDSLFGVAWPVIHIEMGLREDFAAVAMVVLGTMSMAISFFTGPLVRKLGTGTVTAVSTLLTAIGLLGISVAPNIWVILIFMVFMGLGAGAVDAALNSYVAKYYKAIYLSWLHCFWGIGVTLSPLIMSRYLYDANWRGGYKSVFFIQIAITVVLFLSLPLWRKIRTSLQNLLTENTDTDIKETINNKRIRPIKIKGVPYSLLIFAVYCGAEYIIGVWGASFLINARSLSPALAAKWISLYYSGIMLGRFITGFLTIKFSDKALIRGGIFLSSFGLLLLIVPISSSFSFFGLLLIGLGFAPIYPCSVHATPKRFGKEFSADITGYQMGSAALGAFFFQPLFGYIAAATTFKLMPFFLLLMCFLLFFLTEKLNIITSKRL